MGPGRTARFLSEVDVEVVVDRQAAALRIAVELTHSGELTADG